MAKIKYQHIKFTPASVDMLEKINDIIDSYAGMNIDLTLRQLYYRLVAAALIPNTERSYKNIGNLVNSGRLAGVIDWDAIIDRTRSMRRNSHWSDPADIIDSVAYSYAIDHWREQSNYVEVWVEKDAQVGIIELACKPLDVPFFSCRGYVSQSEMWSAAQRLIEQDDNGKHTVIIHLGDHDPSGIDMSRDVEDRLNVFGSYPEFKRIALTMNQINTYNPPPNPAKLTDSRCSKYLDRYGDKSWELDALEPQVTVDLIQDTIWEYLDQTKYDLMIKQENRERELLVQCSQRWNEIEDMLESG